MKNTGFRVGICVFSLSALVATSSSLGAEEINREFHEAFDVEPGMTLKLKHGDGDVTITPWDQDSLDVQVRYHAKTNTVAGWSSKVDLDVTFTNLLQLPGQEWVSFDVENGEFPGRVQDYEGYAITGSPSSVYDDKPWVKALLNCTTEKNGDISRAAANIDDAGAELFLVVRQYRIA